MNSREQILNRVKNINQKKKRKQQLIPLFYAEYLSEHELYKTIPEDKLPETFCSNLQSIKGNCTLCSANDLKNTIESAVKINDWKAIYCNDEEVQQLLQNAGVAYKNETNAFYNTKVAFVKPEALVARFGSVVVSAKNGGRKIHVYPEVYVVIAQENQLVAELSDAFDLLLEKYNSTIPSGINIITGPSRTADIEKTLVLGMHGPKELHVFLVKSEKSS